MSNVIDLEQRLRPGDRVRVRRTAKDEVVRGQLATFVRYESAVVELDSGLTKRLTTNSLELIDQG